MLARCATAALRGFDAQAVTVEVDIAPGLPGLQMVGLADAAVQESRERVRAALRNSGLRVPLTRVVVSLAPADLPKVGPGFDLPIALGLLMASGQLPPAWLQEVWSAGELGLDGHLRPIRGVLAVALAARREGARALLVPAANQAEAALVQGLVVWGAEQLGEALALLADPRRRRPPAAAALAAVASPMADLADVQGQAHGRRALEIAAAGGHHLLLVGPPGSGKTMLARRLPGLLPPLRSEEALEVTQVHSVAGQLCDGSGLIRQRPFRCPHHSCTATALVGGGGAPRPGELSLAHRGVLFLDELAEFRREVLDLLRQPLEDGEVWISRARQRCRFPARVLLVAATNPCPCGFHGEPASEAGTVACRCSEGQRRRYWSRLSGPLLDRLDLQVTMQRPTAGELGRAFAGTAATADAAAAPTPEDSQKVARRVRRARQRMAKRNPGGCCNAEVASAALRAVAQLEPAALQLWERALSSRRLSARGGEKVLRLARTIADLAGSATIGPAAVGEALLYRSYDGCGEGGPA